MTSQKTITFKIEEFDHFGQGVYKSDSNIYFIPKTCVGEEGIARVLYQTKNLFFCELVSLTLQSKDRIAPLCDHFDDCGGCQMQHIPYQEEVFIKLKHFHKHLITLKKLFDQNTFISIINDAQRVYHYRNRIQLHLSNRGELGFVTSDKARGIIEIKKCPVAIEEVEQTISTLEKSTIKDHVEIYLKNNEININIDQDYAKQGFTQVNPFVYAKLQEHLKTISHYFNHDCDHENKVIIDLFSGSGNLSLLFENCGKKRLLIDYYIHGLNPKDEDHFEETLTLEIDIFKHAEIVTSRLKKFQNQVSWFLLDPPRSGIKNLHQFIEATDPEFILYMSCFPSTQVRDLKALRGYKIVHLAIIDFFPRTKHFDTIIVLKRV